MSKGIVALWLVVVLWWLYLTPARPELTMTALLGQSVTLPCVHQSWSPSRYSMCWGRGECPKSKCSQELIQTGGATVTKRTSGRYRLLGNIQRGDVSLTILNTREGDSGVYCCRIEVPGWFNDVKSNIHLVVRRAPTTTRQTITSNPTTTPHLLPTTTVQPATGLTVATSNPPSTSHTVTTTAVLTTPLMTTTSPHKTTPHMPATTAGLPTTFMTTQELTTRAPLQTEATSIFTTTVTVCPLTRSSSASEIAPKTSMQGPTSTAASEAWVHSSASQVTTRMWKTTSMKQAPEPEGETKTTINLIIIASGLGLTLLALLGALLLQGKIARASCLRKHKSLHDLEESQSVLGVMLRGQEDEDGLFTL